MTCIGGEILNRKIKKIIVWPRYQSRQSTGNFYQMYTHKSRVFPKKGEGTRPRRDEFQLESCFLFAQPYQHSDPEKPTQQGWSFPLLKLLTGCNNPAGSVLWIRTQDFWWSKQQHIFPYWTQDIYQQLKSQWSLNCFLIFCNSLDIASASCIYDVSSFLPPFSFQLPGLHVLLLSSFIPLPSCWVLLCTLHPLQLSTTQKAPLIPPFWYPLHSTVQLFKALWRANCLSVSKNLITKSPPLKCQSHLCFPSGFSGPYVTSQPTTVLDWHSSERGEIVQKGPSYGAGIHLSPKLCCALSAVNHKIRILLSRFHTIFYSLALFYDLLY